MKQEEYFHAAWRMLQSQLQEEHENYKKSLAAQKEFEHLKNIKQRIKSLDDSLRSINNITRISIK